MFCFCRQLAINLTFALQTNKSVSLFSAMKIIILILSIIDLFLSKHFLLEVKEETAKSSYHPEAGDYQDMNCMPGYPCKDGKCNKCECSDPEPDPEATCMPGYPCQDGTCSKCKCSKERLKKIMEFSIKH